MSTPRDFGTDCNGLAFTDAVKFAVWEKATPVKDHDPNIRRKDRCGALLEWELYGVTHDFNNGWEIDHILPVTKGGTDDLENLQPLQWQNNRAKENEYPIEDIFYCAVRAK